MSLLPRLLAALALLAFVCTRSRLLVLLSRLVNSVKLPRFALAVDSRLSVWFRCRGGALAGRAPSSEALPPAGWLGLGGTMPASCGWLCVLWVNPGLFLA